MSKRLLGAKWSVHENLRSDVISSDLKYVSGRTSNGDVSGQGGTLQRVLSKFIDRGSGSFLWIYIFASNYTAFPYKFCRASIRMVILDEYRDVETFAGCQMECARKSEI